MILNTTDALGNAYCRQLAQCGFDLILSGPPSDLLRMNSQAEMLTKEHSIKVKVLVIDYASSGSDEELFKQLSSDLKGEEVCIFINNQTNTVPIEFSCMDLIDSSSKSCISTSMFIGLQYSAHILRVNLSRSDLFHIFSK